MSPSTHAQPSRPLAGVPAIACAVAALFFLAAPGFAHAQGSEVDQYVPYVPDSEGKERVGGGGGGDPLPPETAKELAALGPEGEAVAELTQGGPAAETGDGAGGKDSGAGERPSPTSAVIESDSDGLGIVLPLLLVIALAIAGAYAVRRRRAGS